MTHVATATTYLLDDIDRFSRAVLKRPLRRYQLDPLLAILDSVSRRRGLEFLLIFPRQSGKNEAIAQLLVYLLNLLQRNGGNIIYAAAGDGKGLGISRLEERLDNAWNASHWRVKAAPARRILGRAAVVFLSSHPSARTRGQTAHYLLVVDEAQDQLGSHIERVFTPMRAANNATAVYIGTVKTTTDYLWQKKLELEREQRRDGIRRVFLVPPTEVVAENPAYQRFLDAQVRKHGRQHPIVASEYFLEPLDADGSLFDTRRQALMRGTHPRAQAPTAGRLYVATLDVAGQDEAATDPIAQLANPGRDYTVATIFQVVYPLPRPVASGAWGPLPSEVWGPTPGPAYHAVDVFVDHGSKHFQEAPGAPALVHRLLAWLQHWRVAHVVADETGVGQGMVSWLVAALGEHRVTGYNFSGTGQKAALGSAFLSLVETGRFKYWAHDPTPVETERCSVSPGSVSPGSVSSGSVSTLSSDTPTPGTHTLSDAAWFWAQVRACTYEIPPDGRFDRDLRWGVPPGHRTDVPGGRLPTHDDRLLSAALVAEMDRLLRTGAVLLGTAESAVITPADPLAGLGDVY
jgi:hypothetical protein